MVYQIRFIGRKLGAIGIVYEISEHVEAESQDQAIMKLYDKYEHIRILTIDQQ